VIPIIASLLTLGFSVVASFIGIEEGKETIILYFVILHYLKDHLNE
jgi:hypothetical protein